MFTDPQSVTYNGVATSLARLEQSGRTSKYESSDGSLKLSIAHTNGKRERSVVRLDHYKTTADPLLTGVNRMFTMGVYLVVDRPANFGYTDADAVLVYNAVTGLITPAGFRDKFLNQES